MSYQGRNGYDEATVQRAVALAAATDALTAAEQTGISYRTIMRWAKEREVTLPRRISLHGHPDQARTGCPCRACENVRGDWYHQLDSDDDGYDFIRPESEQAALDAEAERSEIAHRETTLAILPNGGDIDWKNRAACADKPQDWWFPDGEQSDGRGRIKPTADRKAYARAKAVCDLCPVQAECLDYALPVERWGMWGGLMPNELSRLHAERMIHPPTTNPHQKGTSHVPA